MSRVLITGVTGQDGSLAARHFIQAGHSVVGTFRRHSMDTEWRLREMGLLDDVQLREWRLEDSLAIRDVVAECQPDLVLHLAAESFPQDSIRQPSIVLGANVLGATYLLEAVRHAHPDARVMMASSSEIFGRASFDRFANEETPHRPDNPYGVSKSAVTQLARVYRDVYGLRTSSLILFNHESSFRGPAFLSRKVAIGVARMMLSETEPPIRLGSLDHKRDWGAAEDFVAAYAALASTATEGDFVVATGHLHSVRHLVSFAFAGGGFSPEFLIEGDDLKCRDAKSGRELAITDRRLERTEPPGGLAGNSSKLRSATGWEPRYALPELMQRMVSAELDRLRLNR